MEGENNQEMPKLCTSGCGFFGNQIFGGQCSKCFKEQSQKISFTEKTGGIKNNHSTEEERLATFFDNRCHIKEPIIESAPIKVEDKKEKTEVIQPKSDLELSESKENKKIKNRCSLCKKKVGLLGFDCRCGNMFCSIHRYAEMHNCPYDYREEAQEEIRKANPVVKAKKVDKI